MFTYLTFQMDR